MENAAATREADFFDAVSDQKIVRENPFYVISPVKLLLLTILNLGTFHIFWIYQNWRANKKNRRFEPISPLFRSVFSVFFIHDFLKRVQIEDDRNFFSDLKVVLFSIFYILLTFLFFANLSLNAQGHFVLHFTPTMFSIPGFLMLGMMFWLQHNLNIICNDKYGKSNEKLTIENWFWILAFWGVLLALIYLAPKYSPNAVTISK